MSLIAVLFPPSHGDVEGQQVVGHDKRTYLVDSVDILNRQIPEVEVGKSSVGTPKTNLDNDYDGAVGVDGHRQLIFGKKIPH